MVFGRLKNPEFRKNLIPVCDYVAGLWRTVHAVSVTAKDVVSTEARWTHNTLMRSWDTRMKNYMTGKLATNTNVAVCPAGRAQIVVWGYKLQQAFHW